MYKNPSSLILLPVISLSILISLFFSSCGQDNKKTVIDYLVQGLEAYQKKDYPVFLSNLKKAVKLAPNNPDMNYNLARAHALEGNRDAAIKYLKKAVRVGFFIHPDHYNDFNTIKDIKVFKEIQNRIKTMKVPVNNSKIAFQISEKDLMPEGIAYDPVDDIFYLGSLYKRKIISVDCNGETRDFVKERQDGLLSVIGMKVDAERRILWVNSACLEIMRGHEEKCYGLTAVFKYSLENGKLIKKYILDTRPILHLFNDLAVNSKGDVFITDSLFNAVYKIPHEKDQIELFVRPRHLTYPNGISLSEDEKSLFVAHREGTSAIDIATKTCTLLSHPETMTIAEIDGLYSFGDSLIAIQRDNWQGRVIQFFFNEKNNKAKSLNIIDLIKKYLSFSENKSCQIKSDRIIESGNHLFSHPTTGVVVDDFFYYIANSQLSKFNSDGDIYSLDKLNEIFILKAKL
jgi:tetratricopeptide (TPR) repeat protein